MKAVMTQKLDGRKQGILDKLWKTLDEAETGNVGTSDIQVRYDGRSWNNGCPYLGRYTDPNHVGSFRVITLKNEADGDKVLINCEGIGGDGKEPASFHLPGWVNPDGSIVIDFSVPPKGGPKDFHGTWDNDGIKFTKDGNKWPQLPREKEQSANDFVN